MDNLNIYVDLILSEKTSMFSIIIATCTPMWLGWIYYLVYGLGKAWVEKTKVDFMKSYLESAKMTMEEARRIIPFGTVIHLVLCFLLAVFMTIYTNGPLQEGQFDNFWSGFSQGLFISVFVVIPVYLSNSIFNQISKILMLIYSLFWIIAIAMVGGIVDAMNHWSGVLP